MFFASEKPLIAMKKTGLDATDIRILSAVQQHGQLSKTRLAELVNLSSTPCWARLDRLKAAGYIRGYHAELALERIIDFTEVVVTVSLGSHRKAEFDRFVCRLILHLSPCLLLVNPGPIRGCCKLTHGHLSQTAGRGSDVWPNGAAATHFGQLVRLPKLC